MNHTSGTFTLRHALALCCLLGCVTPAFGQESPLNDTGQITCYNASASTGTVSTGTPDPEASGFNEQDCTRGSAAADALGKQVKIGASATPGRDYTKIANDGSELDAGATLGSAASDWACTRDNLTGLIWEVKVDDAANLRHYKHTHTWYDTDADSNGGEAGDPGWDSCNGTLPAAHCNTSALRDAVNDIGLCGANSWRLPTIAELQSLVDYGAATAPYIDASYFPNTGLNVYWSGVNHADDPAQAWSLYFGTGERNPDNKAHAHVLLLVHGGP